MLSSDRELPAAVHQGSGKGAVVKEDVMVFSQYAMRDTDTRGRRFPEEPHPYRSVYQRDRDRVVHTKAFRRLEKKTQVFAPHHSDHFRNRLTHTIEVSQVARTISDALGLNSHLCETLALSHDIGHPPFGHWGETILNRLMSAHGSGFEHNLHALRIVEYFEQKYLGFRGLNLTFEVREGIVKHSRDYAPGEKTYIDISEYCLEKRPLLEAQVIDLADEIAYNTADLDDGYASGLLSLEQLMEELALFRRIYLNVERDYPGAPAKLAVGETIRGLIDSLVTSLIRNTRARLESRGIASVEAVREYSSRLVGLDPETEIENGQLKSFLHAHLYNQDVLQIARDSVGKLLEDLFQYYMNCPEELPERLGVTIHEFGLSQVVCDYIAGMTDSFAEARHREISR